MEIREDARVYVKDLIDGSLSRDEHRKRNCLCGSLATTVLLVPDKSVFYRKDLSKIGVDVLNSVGYLLGTPSVNSGLSSSYSDTFFPDTYNDNQMYSRSMVSSIGILEKPEILYLAEFGKNKFKDNEYIRRLLAIKDVTGEELEALKGILREMAYIDYRQRHSVEITEEEILGRSKCKLYTKAAFEELAKFKTR